MCGNRGISLFEERGWGYDFSRIRLEKRAKGDGNFSEGLYEKRLESFLSAGSIIISCVRPGTPSHRYRIIVGQVTD